MLSKCIDNYPFAYAKSWNLLLYKVKNWSKLHCMEFHLKRSKNFELKLKMFKTSGENLSQNTQCGW